MSAILIVDDSADNRSFCELIAKMFNFQKIEMAANADEAVALIEGGFKPSVVFLDFLMPGRDPKDVVTAVRSRPELKDTSVVLMSAVREVMREARKIGADDAIRKPFAMEKLVDHFRRYAIGS